MNVKYFHFISIPTYQLHSFAPSEMGFTFFFVPVWTLLQRTEDVYLSGLYSNFFFFLSLWIIFAPQQVRSPLWACVSYRNAFHIRYRQVEHTSCCAPSLRLFESSKVDPHNGMSELSGLAVYAGGHCIKGLIIKIFLIFHLRRLRHTFGCPV